MTYVLLFLLLFFGASARANPSLPFRVQEQHGIWQLITPRGDPMFSLGVCCVNRGTPREKYDAAKPAYAAWQEYPDPAVWADNTLRRLKSWGFTTIGGWS